MDYAIACPQPSVSSVLDLDRLIDCIGQVESGGNPHARNGLAFGAYQMRPRATQDATKRLIAEGYKGRLTQKVVALAYLRCILSHLLAMGIRNPLPQQVALCWNLGVTGAASRGFVPNDYARRVGNLYHANK